MRQQGFVEGSPARGERPTMRQEVLQAEKVKAVSCRESGREGKEETNDH
jgi:hypothetical protein